jgi:cytochrome c oxidase subunit 4
MSLSQSENVAAPVADDAGHAGHAAGAHAVPKRILIGVYVALLVLTAITVSVSKIDLGNFNILVALAVAVIKGTLVALFFMHLLWDSPFNAIILVAAFFFVALFIGITLLDSHSYQPNLTAPQSIHAPQ